MVGGGDCGSVYVFDHKQGTRLQKLQHAHEGMVQSIAVPLQGCIYGDCKVPTTRGCS